MSERQRIELKRIDSHDVDAVVAALDADGACIALDVLPAALCDTLLNDFAPHLGELSWGTDELGYRDNFYGNETKRLHGLFSKSQAMGEVLTHPLFLAVARRLLIDTGRGKEVRLSNAELMVLNGGQDNQDFHTDAVSWAHAQQLMDGEILVSANCALTDFTATNGATRVVPGSHRWTSARDVADDEVCLAVMPKGSALLYTGNAVHSGGANREPAPRTGLYLGYVVSWLRPIENHLVTNDPADVLSLPESAQRLLDVAPGGFTVYA